MTDARSGRSLATGSQGQVGASAYAATPAADTGGRALPVSDATHEARASGHRCCGSKADSSSATSTSCRGAIRRRLRTCAAGRRAPPIRALTVRASPSVWAGTGRLLSNRAVTSPTQVAWVVIPSPRPVVALAVAAVLRQGWRSHRLRPKVLDGAPTVRLTSGRSGRRDCRPGDLPRIPDPRPGVRGRAPVAVTEGRSMRRRNTATSAVRSPCYSTRRVLGPRPPGCGLWFHYLK